MVTLPVPALYRRFAHYCRIRTRRLLFVRSIAFKNLLIFVPAFLLALGPLSYSYWKDTRAGRIGQAAARLDLIAEQSAKRIDVELVASMRLPEQTGTAAHNALVEVLAAIEHDFGVDNAVLMRRQPTGRFEYIADGAGRFRVKQPVFLHERFPETLAAANAAWEGTGVAHTELFGFGTFEYLQQNKALMRGEQVIAVLLINKFAEEVDQLIRTDTLRLVGLTLAILALGAGVFWLFSSRLLRPLVDLKGAAEQVAAGDLQVYLRPLKRRDEVAQLSASFQTMVDEVRRSRDELQHSNAELKRALTRVQMMEDLEASLFKFVPRSARLALHSDPTALERGKTDTDVTVLFLDIEGSTTLSESLEPTRMDSLIERYFSAFLDPIYEHNGDITETAGDGLMLIFQDPHPAQHARNAVRAATAIQRITAAIGAEVQAAGGRHLRVNIGINSGRALVGFTKYESIAGTRVTFTASGRTTIVAARLQDLATAGSVLISEETLQRLGGAATLQAQQFEVQALGERSLKNLHEPIAVYHLHTTRERPAGDS